MVNRVRTERAMGEAPEGSRAYDEPAGGWGALHAVANTPILAVRDEYNRAPTCGRSSY